MLWRFVQPFDNGGYVLFDDRVKIAEPAEPAFLQANATVVKNPDLVEIAQTSNRCSIGKASVARQSSALSWQCIKVDSFAPREKKDVQIIYYLSTFHGAATNTFPGTFTVHLICQ